MNILLIGCEDPDRNNGNRLIIQHVFYCFIHFYCAFNPAMLNQTSQGLTLIKNLDDLAE